MAWIEIGEKKWRWVEDEKANPESSSEPSSKEFGCPAFHGRQKPGGLKECHIRMADPLNTAKRQLKAIEAAGKMTPEIAMNGRKVIKGLERRYASGEIKPYDYGKYGHPLELPDGVNNKPINRTEI